MRAPRKAPTRIVRGAECYWTGSALASHRSKLRWVKNDVSAGKAKLRNENSRRSASALRREAASRAELPLITADHPSNTSFSDRLVFNRIGRLGVRKTKRRGCIGPHSTDEQRREGARERCHRRPRLSCRRTRAPTGLATKAPSGHPGPSLALFERRPPNLDSRRGTISCAHNPQKSEPRFAQ